MGTQVSGSIALDLSKVVRETVRATVDELVRTEPTEQEREHGVPLAVDVLARTVSVEVVRSVMPALAEISNQLNELTALVRAEMARGQRMTGEIPVVVGYGGQGGQVAGGGGSSYGGQGGTVTVGGPDGQGAVGPDFWPGEDQPTNPGIDADDNSGQVDR